MGQRGFPDETPILAAKPHFVDENMCRIIRARIVELYDRDGLAAFQFPGVQEAIGLLLDAGEGEAASRLYYKHGRALTNGSPKLLAMHRAKSRVSDVMQSAEAAPRCGTLPP